MLRNFADFGQGLVRIVRKRFGLLLLILLLLVITAGMIKPGFYFLGWDNFSSYFNPSSNIFNTLFATWREYRGLGVPSDAEVNDIFRQIFCLFGSFFVPQELVDQLYIVFMLWGGVLGMYALGRKVSGKLFQSANKQELFGFLAAFFYLFNLSTLAVFYFPMIMYNTRFFMLPTTTFVLLSLLDRPQISIRTYVFYLIVLFIGFGSYMVPTVFIVMMLFLLMFLFFRKTKWLVITLVFYVLLSMYWLLPFANYTKQKAEIVPQAPIFIDINEAMLNKPKSYYSFERQAKLRPNFFDSKFSNLETGLSQPFHELAAQSEKGIVRGILWIFPILYLSGIAYVFLFKRERILMWFSTSTLIFLTLSMKEYSPAGFLYSFISDHIPFADTVFRFGDTKFHAMIAFGGAVISAFLLVSILSAMMKRVRFRIAVYLAVGVFIFLHLFVYKSYFTGNFIGFFMYNKIPSAYFEMAKIINQDPEAIRVIHLPLDSHSYWKPYRWGYFGSSFLNFMLNKPLFDRSFEPASMENADLHEKIVDILRRASFVSDDSMFQEQALDLYNLLRSLSIKYIIDDQTISTNIDTRNVAYWGTINPIDSHRLLAYLEKMGYLKLVEEYKVSPQDYVEDYAKLYPYNKNQSITGSSYNIQLYELSDIAPRIQVLSEVNKVHSFQTPLSPAIRKSLDHYIQKEEDDSNSLIFPFAMTQSKKQTEDNQIKLSLPIKLNSGNYVFESKRNIDASSSQMVNVYIQKMDKLVRVYFEYLVFPVIEGISSQKTKAYTVINLNTKGDDYMYLKVGDSVLPIESISEEEMQFIGSVLIHDNSIPVSLLYPQNTYNVGGNLVQLEPNPRCLNDALENATSDITGDNGVLNISGQNVSNCLTTDVKIEENQTSFAQLEFETMGTSESLLEEKEIDTGKPRLVQYVNGLKNPLIMEICIKISDSVVCENKTSLFPIKEEKKKYMVPIVGDLKQIDKFLITFTVRSSQRQKYETNTTNIFLKTFISGKPENFIPMLPEEYKDEYKLEDDTDLNLIMPIAKSDYSQFIDLKDDGALFRHDEECDKQGKTQAIKKNSNGILSLVVGCRNFVQKNISFSSNNYYLWLTKYKHLSGAMPAFIIMSKLDEYYFSKFLPDDVGADDYFSTPLQRPELFLTNEQRLTEAIDNAPLYTIGGYLEPRFGMQDSGNKELIIQHHSQNEGFIELNNVSLIELPNNWSDSRIRPRDYQATKFETQAKLVSYKRILPSLWQVKTNAEKEGDYLVLFNEQYDSQWVALNGKTLLHARCDGYVNCFKIKLSKGLSTVYFFYKPETLSFIGFIITSLAIIVGLFKTKFRDEKLRE
jgi:hypothetical protein